MTARTAFLARLLGLFMVVIALAMAGNRDATVTAFLMLIRDPDVMWVTGMIGVAGGLALVLGHNRWTGGAPTIAVTVLGWIILLKSVAVLALPPEAFAFAADWLQSPAFLYADAIALFALGLYLAVAGFTAKAGPPI